MEPHRTNSEIKKKKTQRSKKHLEEKTGRKKNLEFKSGAEYLDEKKRQAAEPLYLNRYE
jgi:hypothetical protein